MLKYRTPEMAQDELGRFLYWLDVNIGCEAGLVEFNDGNCLVELNDLNVVEYCEVKEYFEDVEC